MLDESVKQYKDYYESDAEEQEFFEYLDQISNRDKIRFMEVFEDYTISTKDNKGFAKIPKREFNPELSVFSNMVLDLVDFNDRVRPLAQDMSLLDKSHGFQRVSVSEAREQYELDDFSQSVKEVETTDEVPEIERDPSPEEEPAEQEPSEEDTHEEDATKDK